MPNDPILGMPVATHLFTLAVAVLGDPWSCCSNGNAMRAQLFLNLSWAPRTRSRLLLSGLQSVLIEWWIVLETKPLTPTI